MKNETHFITFFCCSGVDEQRVFRHGERDRGRGWLVEIQVTFCDLKRG